LDEPLGVGQQQFARGREVKALPVAVEQRHPQRSFELLDPRCDARGHPMQLACSFDDASFIDNELEYLKIDKVHRRQPILILDGFARRA
jgi:hypothetical protein